MRIAALYAGERSAATAAICARECFSLCQNGSSDLSGGAECEIVVGRMTPLLEFNERTREPLQFVRHRPPDQTRELGEFVG